MTKILPLGVTQVMLSLWKRYCLSLCIFSLSNLNGKSIWAFLRRVSLNLFGDSMSANSILSRRSISLNSMMIIELVWWIAFAIRVKSFGTMSGLPEMSLVTPFWSSRILIVIWSPVPPLRVLRLIFVVLSLLLKYLSWRSLTVSLLSSPLIYVNSRSSSESYCSSSSLSYLFWFKAVMRLWSSFFMVLSIRLSTKSLLSQFWSNLWSGSSKIILSFIKLGLVCASQDNIFLRTLFKK